jgi:hypothetical protein
VTKSASLSTATEISLVPKKIVYTLSFVGLVLIGASLAGDIARYSFGYQVGFYPALFDIGLDNNIPTWYQSFLLLFAAFFLGIIAFVKWKMHQFSSRAWLMLSLIFLGLSIDEVACIHERAGYLLRKVPSFSGLSSLSGFLYYEWVIIYIPLTLLVAIAFARFVWRLPPDVRRLMVLSGVLYVGGGIGVEMFAALQHSTQGQENLTYALLTLCEESLEMAGQLLFISALLLYIHSSLKGITIHLGGKAEHLSYSVSVEQPPELGYTSVSGRDKI